MPDFKVEEIQNMGTEFNGRTDYHITLNDGEQKIFIKTSNRAAVERFKRGAFYKVVFTEVKDD